MATINHKIQVVNGNSTDIYHPETNTAQVYDYNNSAWLSSTIGYLNTLTTTAKTSLVASLNELASTKANATALTTHTSTIATTSQLGHVRPDGVTITIDNNGIITAIGGGGGGSVEAHTHTTSQIINLDTTLAAKAPLASPTFTGTPAAPTPTAGTNTTQLATTAFVTTAVANVPSASITVKGIVQLNNTLTSTSTSLALTAAQGKALNDALTSHTGDTNIHVTTANKTDWNAKETTTGSQTKVNTHASVVATTSQLGHVKPDGTTITIDGNGVITAIGGGSGGSLETHTHPTSQITGLDTALAAKAPLISPTFTGTPLAPTATAGTNTTQLATTAFVTTAIANKTSVTGNAGTATKLETARTINGVSFDGSANITIVDSTKAPLASPALTGTPTAPTATTGTSTTQLATTAFVTTAVNLKANLASPSFTGTPLAPTASTTTNTTQIATTAFVQSVQNSHLSDYMPHDSGLSQYSSSVDASGFYRVVEYKRPDTTLYLKSTASNPNAQGRYQTITWQFYAANGTTLALTKTWTITYDTNGVIVSKVVA